MPILRDADTNWNVLPRRERTLYERIFGDTTNASAAQQIAVGGVTGWIAGYVSGKLSKALAVAVGGSLLLLQIADHHGYVQIRWHQVKKELRKAQRELERHTQDKSLNADDVINGVSAFVAENVLIAGSFAVGFLLGLAT